MRPVYKITRGSLQERYFASRAKIQLYGGGFANGKTSALCMRVLQIARDYPGSTGLVARETLAKLNDTVLAEMKKWLPPKWIKSFTGGDDRPTLVLQNGSIINFRYIQQQGKKGEASTSNLLSANYDYAAIDQLDDPGITYKDFLDLLGRLRGSTPYRGDDPSMPKTGPRWLLLTCNPTRNWVYRKLVMPLHLYKRSGQRIDDLLVDKITLEPIIELFEGSTLDNADNLASDYIDGLQSAYKGQMYKRFVLGEWGAYEGLVYPEFNPTLHVVPKEEMIDYWRYQKTRVRMKYLQGYDYGSTSPSCYLVAFVDEFNNVCVLDGYYEANALVKTQVDAIKGIRTKFSITGAPHADPSIFKKIRVNNVVGNSISSEFEMHGLSMTPGANSIAQGIDKIRTHLTPELMRRNPFTHTYGASRFYISDHLQWWQDEITDYMWKKDPQGNRIDEPMDENDHAMDTTKYMMTPRSKVMNLLPAANVEPLPYMRWGEMDAAEVDRRVRTRHTA